MRLSIILICCALVASCKKDQIKTTTSTTEITIKKNALYTLDLGSACDECGVVISRQAKHFSRSEIILNTTGQNFNFIYYYQPLTDFEGSDEVEIKRTSGSDGSSSGNIVHLNTIKLTVTN